MPSHSRTTTSYNHRHRKIRAALIPAAIGTMCPGDVVNGQPYRSRNCDRIMTNTSRMHLAHTLPRALGGQDGDRINCAPCNLGAGAILGNQLRPPQPTGHIPTRRCNVCTTDFQPHHHKQRCCSQQCRDVLTERADQRAQGQRQRTPPVVLDLRNCTECGAEFAPNHAVRITCSAECLKRRTTRRRQHAGRTAADREAARRYRVSEKGRVAQQRAREAYKARHVNASTTSVCTECGNTYDSVGTRRVTCSPICLRVRTTRLRRESKLTH